MVGWVSNSSCVDDKRGGFISKKVSIPVFEKNFNEISLLFNFIVICTLFCVGTITSNNYLSSPCFADRFKVGTEMAGFLK